MKTFFLSIIALMFVARSDAQSLKWTYTPAQPAFEFERSDLNGIASDATGNVAFFVVYRMISHVRLEARLVWLDRNGREIHKAEFPLSEEIGGPYFMHISPTELWVVWYSTATQKGTIRRYTREGKKVTFTDTEFPESDSPLTPSLLARDPKGYFFQVNSEGKFVSLRRYNFK